MSFRIFASIVLLCAISCIVPQEARILKKRTKDWRKSDIVLNAYSDSPMAGTFLTLRVNGKFEHYSSGILKTFETGSWSSRNDTIMLDYVNEDEEFIGGENIYLDTATVTIIFEGETTLPFLRLKVLLNEL